MILIYNALPARVTDEGQMSLAFWLLNFGVKRASFTPNKFQILRRTRMSHHNIITSSCYHQDQATTMKPSRQSPLSVQTTLGLTIAQSNAASNIKHSEHHDHLGSSSFVLA
jgi:hypothetical protein